jgi:hypothetical protein
MGKERKDAKAQRRKEEIQRDGELRIDGEMNTIGQFIYSAVYSDSLA